MNILINLQSFDDFEVYEELIKLSNDDKIDKIFLISSLMHDLDKITHDKYNNINKLTLLESNTFFSNKYSNYDLNLSSDTISTEKLMLTDILSSYRWLPISKRSENDFMSFSMLFYYDIYNYWINFFSNNQIDYIIQLNEEHSSFDSILIRVGKEYKVPNIITSRVVGAYTANAEEYHALYDNIKEEYIKINQHDYISSKLDESSNFAVFSDAYKSNILDKIKFFSQKLFQLNNEDISLKLKLAKLYKVIENKIYTKFKLFNQYLYVKDLKKYYEKISITNIDLEEKYIYYCLHFDPEAATLPKDNAYSNQLLNLRILSSALPSGWKIYVKEHPHQLSYNIYYGYLLNQLHSVDNFRSKTYYEYINSIENVELVGLQNNHQELIKKSKFVVSNTGTIFREASYLNKQCITFSNNSFYALLDNVNNAYDTISCKDLIKSNMDKIATNSNVDKIFHDYSVTITDINKISSIMLKTIINRINNI